MKTHKEIVMDLARDILRRCWVGESTITEKESDWLDAKDNTPHKMETRLDTALRLAGIDYNWRLDPMSDRAGKIKALLSKQAKGE